MKSTQLYDFTLTAFGSQAILADANFYKVLTSSGDLKITRDGGSTVRPMRAGRGEREVEFKTLMITDISGAPNSGTIVVGDSNFIDDTIVLSSAINVRPEGISSSWADTSALTANTPLTVFTPASNTAGVILLNAGWQQYNGTSAPAGLTFLAKTSAPTTVIDGEVVLSMNAGSISGAASWNAGFLPAPILIAAGKGLYLISADAQGAIAATTPNLRHARWKTL